MVEVLTKIRTGKEIGGLQVLKNPQNMSSQVGSHVDKSRDE